MSAHKQQQLPLHLPCPFVSAFEQVLSCRVLFIEFRPRARWARWIGSCLQAVKGSKATAVAAAALAPGPTLVLPLTSATFYQLPDLKSVPSPRRLAHKILMRRICLIRRVVFPKFLNPAAKSFCFRVCIPATSCNYKRIMTFMTPDCLSVCVCCSFSFCFSTLRTHFAYNTRAQTCTARSFIKWISWKSRTSSRKC